MKTFKDLVFDDHRFFQKGERAEMTFDNGYTISVIKWNDIYGGDKPYECACLYPYGEEVIFHRFPNWDDVVKRFSSEEEITELMIQIQQL